MGILTKLLEYLFTRVEAYTLSCYLEADIGCDGYSQCQIHRER